jgi:hypothetical protein
MGVEQQTHPEGRAAQVDTRGEILCHEPFALLPVAQQRSAARREPAFFDDHKGRQRSSREASLNVGFPPETCRQRWIETLMVRIA